MRHRVETPDGVHLSAHEWGDPDGPEILFIHGMAQAHLCFARQFDSGLAERFRLVAFDLRGHGDSDKPTDPACYVEGRRWADDVAAVIEATALRRPVAIGWSLGGRVLRQYVADHGDGHLAGINIVSSRAIEDPSVLGAGSLANLEKRPDDLGERIRASIVFLSACFLALPDEDDFHLAIAYNTMVPAAVHDAIGGWRTDVESCRRALRTVTVPTLVSHGRDDRLVLPVAAEMIGEVIGHARLSWYDNCGHSPFYEQAERFNRELAAFVDAANEAPQS